MPSCRWPVARGGRGGFSRESPVYRPPVHGPLRSAYRRLGTTQIASTPDHRVAEVRDLHHSCWAVLRGTGSRLTPPVLLQLQATAGVAKLEVGREV